MTTIDELYCNIADFNQFFYPEWEKTLLESGDKKRRRQGVMSPGELMTILINFHQSHYKDFKSYYLCHVHQHLGKSPNLLSYTRFPVSDVIGTGAIMRLLYSLQKNPNCLC